MYTIRTLNNIAKTGLAKLPEQNFVIDEKAENPEGIILRSFDMHKMELNESLLAVARAGAGTNNIPIEKCTQKGVPVFNTPGANANAVKELVLAGLFASSRRIIAGAAWVQGLKDNCESVEKAVEDEMEAAYQFANESAYPDPSEATTDVYFSDNERSVVR
jgi:D-3-phosphoglycerate dehydrogenase